MSKNNNIKIKQSLPKWSTLLGFISVFGLLSFVWLMLYTFFFVTHFPIIDMPPGRSPFDLVLLPIYLLGYLVPVAVVAYVCYFGNNRSLKTVRIYTPIAVAIYFIEILFIFISLR